MTDQGKRRFELDADEARSAGKSAEAVRNFRLILFCSQRLRHLMDQHLRDADLTSQQGVLLSVVRARGQPALGEVASAMATSHQNAKQIAAGLERKGMLRIVQDKADGRVKRLTATAAGSRGWEWRNESDFRMIGEWFSELSRADQKTLRQLLEQLANSLGEG